MPVVRWKTLSITLMEQGLDVFALLERYNVDLEHVEAVEILSGQKADVTFRTEIAMEGARSRMNGDQRLIYFRCHKEDHLAARCKEEEVCRTCKNMSCMSFRSCPLSFASKVKQSKEWVSGGEVSVAVNLETAKEDVIHADGTEETSLAETMDEDATHVEAIPKEEEVQASPSIFDDLGQKDIIMDTEETVRDWAAESEWFSQLMLVEHSQHGQDHV